MKPKPHHSHEMPGASAPRSLVRVGMTGVSWLMFFLLICAAMFVQAQDVAQIRQQERDVKVAIIYKLLRFVEWPEAKLMEGEPLKLCLWPGEPYTQTFKEIEGSRVASHVLLIEQLNDTSADSCHALFSSMEDRRTVNQWRAMSDGHPILTISDVENFAAQAGMVHLMMRDQRVVFSVNVKAMENARLRMSALVLNLAGIQQSNLALPQIQTPAENSNE